MTLPRRLQLMKLLGSRGLRNVERMRDEEIRQVLGKLRMIPSYANRDAPPSSSTVARRSEAVVTAVDEDDPHALPRFREPRLSLPDHERTFLRAIAQKPRVCFFTWDVVAARRQGGARLELRWAEFLGEEPDSAELLQSAPALIVDVDVSAGGWYVPVPGERLAVIGRLVDASGEIAVSNVTLTPPARPAPPGPLWLATLPPSIDRRTLRERKLLDGQVPEAQLTRVGESDARLLSDDDDQPTSGSLYRRRAGPSTELPSSHTSLGEKR